MNSTELDQILVKLCSLVLQGQRNDPDFYGMVGACIVGPNGQVGRISYSIDDKFVHAERAAIYAYEKAHGPVTDDCICVTTLSPCCNNMSDRMGSSCSDLLDDKGITQVYAGYRDPSQSNSKFTVTGKYRGKQKALARADAVTPEVLKPKGKGTRPNLTSKGPAKVSSGFKSLQKKSTMRRKTK